MRRKITIGIIAIVSVTSVLLFSGCVAPPTPTPMPTPTPTPSILTVSAPELYFAYKENEIAADEKYKGKIVEVSDVVDNIGKDILDTPYITLYTGEILGSVQCMFEKKYEPQLVQLRKGMEVRVQGRCSGFVLLNVILDDCTFLEVRVPSPSPIPVATPSPSPTIPVKISQVLIKVEYSAGWQGAYGDQNSIISWSGEGTKTVTVNRPSDAWIWIISANAQKMDGSNDVLTIKIMKLDGTVLREASTTTPYGVAQISHTF